MKVNHSLLALLYSNVTFLTFIFSDNSKPLRIIPYKILARLSDVTYELLSQDGSILHVQRNHFFSSAITKNNSPTITNDNSSFKHLTKTHQNELLINKSRHPSQNQSTLPNTSFDRNVKTHYNLRHQPKKKGLSSLHTTFKTLKQSCTTSI